MGTNLKNQNLSSEEAESMLRQQLKIVNALSRNYLNVFLINPKEDRLRIIKLDGYITQGLKFEDGSDTIYSYNAIASQYIKDRVHPVDVEMMTEVLSTENVLSVMANSDEYSHNYRVLVNNETHYYQFKCIKLESAPGEKELIIAAFQNIDDIIAESEAKQKELQRALSVAKSRQSIIASVSKLFFCIYSIDIVNGRFVELEPTKLGVVEESIGTEGEVKVKVEDMCKYLVIPEHGDSVREFLNLSTMAKRLKGVNSISMQFKGPHVGWCEALICPSEYDEDGSCVKCTFCVRSIQEEKSKDEANLEREREQAKVIAQALEDVKQADAAKSTFMFSMSHDIRTPMNAILGYTDLLEKQYTTEGKSKEYLKNIRVAGNYLLNIINGVLEMSRIVSGNIEKKSVLVDIKKYIGDLKVIFEEEYTKHNLNIIRDIEIEHSHVYLDSEKCNEIYLNIISNAIKYTPDGGTIRMFARELPGKTEKDIILHTTVEDTGVGMSEDFIPRIFDSFSREKTVTENKIAGNGLGMGIVKKLIDIIGGDIKVESKLGVGTKITVDIPVEIKIDEVEDNNVLNMQYAKELKGKHILYAEDNDLNAEILKEILDEFDIHVDIAADGLICIEMLKDSEDDYYDLVLMDIQMPNLDGYETTKEIRKFRNKIKASKPIVALTANALAEDKAKAFDVGMNDHLAKPIELPKLINTLHKYIFNNF